MQTQANTLPNYPNTNANASISANARNGKIFSFLSGCVWKALGCHRLLTFCLWWLEKPFKYKLKDWAPTISWLGTCGLLEICSLCLCLHLHFTHVNWNNTNVQTHLKSQYLVSSFIRKTDCVCISYQDYQSSKAWRVWWPGFDVPLLLLSRATGSISSGNLLAFDVISSKAHKIIVTIGKEESYPWQHFVTIACCALLNW